MMQTNQLRNWLTPSQKICIFLSTLSFSFFALQLGLKAATFKGDFTVDITSGSLIGEEFSGAFLFNDSVLTGTGFESVGNGNGRFNFEFEWLGVTYQENSNPGFASRAEFADGAFQGVRYFLGFNQPTPNFSLMLDGFRYEDSTGSLNSLGVVRYGELERVPEPLTVLGSMMTLAIGTGWVTIQKSKRKVLS